MSSLMITPLYQQYQYSELYTCTCMSITDAKFYNSNLVILFILSG